MTRIEGASATEQHAPTRGVSLQPRVQVEALQAPPNGPARVLQAPVHAPLAPKVSALHEPGTPRRVVDAQIRDPYLWLETPSLGSTGDRDHIQVIGAWMTEQNRRTESALNHDAAREQRYVFDRALRLASRSTLGSAYENEESQITARSVPGVARRAIALRTQTGSRTLADEGTLERIFGGDHELEIKSQGLAPDNKHLAISVVKNGSDIGDILVVDVATTKIVDHVTTLFSDDFHWLDANHLVYATMRVSPEVLQRNPRFASQPYVHTLGSKQVSDVRFGGQVDQDVLARLGADLLVTRGDDVFVVPQGSPSLLRGEPQGLVARALRLARGDSPVALDKSRRELIVQTHAASADDRGQLLAYPLGSTSEPVDGTKPKPRVIVASRSDAMLTDAAEVQNGYALRYRRALADTMVVCDRNGKAVATFDPTRHGLPSGAIGWMEGRRNGHVRFAYSSSLHPDAVFDFDPQNGALRLIWKSPVDFDGSKFSEETVIVTSADGAKVPMRVLERRGASGPRPTLMYGYGGFNTDSNNKHFVDAELLPFLEAGGRLAFPVVRGGGELGDAWHQAAVGDKKQKSYDDFIAAAQWLVDHGRTTPQQLAAIGYSNGGLMMSAMAVQRPNLFAALVPVVGPHDLLRFPLRGFGQSWTAEYGNPLRNRTDLDRLERLSPYNTITRRAYPAMLVLAGQKDTRVDPGHSRKLAARLQANQTGAAPIYSYYVPTAGHGRDHDPDRRARVNALWLGFVMHATGLAAPTQ